MRREQNSQDDFYFSGLRICSSWATMHDAISLFLFLISRNPCSGGLRKIKNKNYRGIAQLAARMHGVHEALGSNPSTPTNDFYVSFIFHR